MYDFALLLLNGAFEEEALADTTKSGQLLRIRRSFLHSEKEEVRCLGALGGSSFYGHDRMKIETNMYSTTNCFKRLYDLKIANPETRIKTCRRKHYEFLHIHTLTLTTSNWRREQSPDQAES